MSPASYHANIWSQLMINTYGDESYEHPVIAMRRMAEEQQKLEDTERLRETLQAREERKEEERLANDKKGFLNAIDKLEAERRARDN